MKAIFLGSTLPLNRSNLGYFATTSDALANEKSKFINLILTMKGERVGNSKFGCDLGKLLFEPKTEDIQAKAQQYVTDAVNTFMPYLVLQSIQITNLDTFTTDNNLALYVRYGFINNPNATDSLQVLLGSPPTGGVYTAGRISTRNY